MRFIFKDMLYSLSFKKNLIWSQKLTFHRKRQCLPSPNGLSEFFFEISNFGSLVNVVRSEAPSEIWNAFFRFRFTSVSLHFREINEFTITLLC